MRDFDRFYVGFGSKARITASQHCCPLHLNERISAVMNRGFLRATCGLVHCSKRRSRVAIIHSITSSAMASTPGGIVRPSALAVLRLTTSSNLVGCTTGKSAGFSPLRTRPV